jgi:hypothetical protein
VWIYYINIAEQVYVYFVWLCTAHWLCSVVLQGIVVQGLPFSVFMKVIVLCVEAYWARLLASRQCDVDGRRMWTWNTGVMMIIEKCPSNLTTSRSVLSQVRPPKSRMECSGIKHRASAVRRRWLAAWAAMSETSCTYTYLAVPPGWGIGPSRGQYVRRTTRVQRKGRCRTRNKDPRIQEVEDYTL